MTSTADDNVVAPACNNPRWEIRVDLTVIGAISRFTRADVQGCLDYCVETLSCVGVDVNYLLNPVECWPHTDSADYVEDNIYEQPGTTSYQLLERCAATTSTGTATTTTSTSTSTSTSASTTPGLPDTSTTTSTTTTATTTSATTTTPTTTTTTGNAASVTTLRSYLVTLLDNN